MNKTFPKGFIYKEPEKAPQWIKAKISIKVDEFIQFLQENENNGWVNIDICESKDGTKRYPVLNTYKKKD